MLRKLFHPASASGNQFGVRRRGWRAGLRCESLLSWCCRVFAACPSLRLSGVRQSGKTPSAAHPEHSHCQHPARINISISRRKHDPGPNMLISRISADRSGPVLICFGINWCFAWMRFASFLASQDKNATLTSLLVSLTQSSQNIQWPFKKIEFFKLTFNVPFFFSSARIVSVSTTGARNSRYLTWL